MLLSFLLPTFLFLSVSAGPKSIHDGHDSHTIAQRLPSSHWSHPRDHLVHQLFARDVSTDGATYPEVGSPTWSAQYPQSTPDSSQLPAAWINALRAAEQAGSIPDVPQSTSLQPNTNPIYPKGQDPGSPEICSATYKCRIPGDIWDAPDGFIGTGFDDGPTEASPALLDFLEANNETVTHFMIGLNILSNSASFTRTVELGHSLAVHTWTHPYMTTLSNEDVLAQLGWTMQLIHDSTGGRVPKFWRPPYGDTDLRVSAIAKEVFNLETIIWNQDTEDWSLTSNGTTLQAINASMTTWLTGPKSPGLIILEHELSNQSVTAFESAYPVMKSNGWNLMSVAELVAGNSSVYRNALSVNSGDVTPANILNPDLPTTAPATSTATSTTTTSSSSSKATTSSTTSESASPTSRASSNNSSANSGSSSRLAIGISTVFGAIISACVLLL
ncbi:carbohydrate esterase family 4 protein [Collybiopsis luxurians FD-317 M1]|nr:carbohydrate esterase family 4 protein [Collybiopsis luxurians FD-317 M1]